MSFASVLRVLRRLTSIEIVASLMYRTQFFVYMLSTIAGVVVGLFIWSTVEASGADLPLNREQIVTYYLLMAVVRVVTSTWHSEYLATMIRQGELNAWLVRPGSYLLNLLANNFAEKLVKVGAILPLLCIVWFFYRSHFSVPTDLGKWTLFAIAVLGAVVIEFGITTSVGALGFWLDDNAGIARTRHLLTMVLAGQLFPLAMYPVWMSGFLDWQPFRFVISFPLEVLLFDLSANHVIIGFGLMTGWMIGFVSLTWFIWQRGLRAYTAVGA